ncbi:MAG: hypothetical protein ACOX1Y_07400 [Zhaonellaceae bacterium]
MFEKGQTFGLVVTNDYRLTTNDLTAMLLLFFPRGLYSIMVKLLF